MRRERIAVAVDPHDDEMHKEEESHGVLFPFTSRPRFVRLMLLFIVALSFFIMWRFCLLYDKFKFFFLTGQLGAGQIACWTICLTIIFSYFAFWIFYILPSTAGGPEFVSRRQVLTEDGEMQLKAAAEFSFYMILFYFADRTDTFARDHKHPDKDTFWFLWAVLCIVALFTIRKAKPPKQGSSEADAAAASSTFHVPHLQRDQTEEWKGWMQVMFLWYHYFNAKEIYNVIRLYIAAYVWMTGFGNFSYYYIRKDFSFSRFLQMQWRLNFMVIWVCAILANEYMLYYINFLHTLFTVMIYAGLGLFSHLNYTTAGVTAKFAFLGLLSFLVWDVNGVFEVVWKPLSFLVQFHDPYNTDRPVLAEWQFRSFLDHFIWIVGMICAFNHPRLDSLLLWIDSRPERVSNLIKLCVVSLCLFIGYIYVHYVFLLPKKEYNKVHPYTSFIPIILFIVLRNIFTTARMYHIHLFEFLGKTTLETYIGQFHIWMATTGLNGSPKQLIRVTPEGWPLLNFAIMSVVFCFISYRLFQTTNIIKGAILPSKASNAILKRNLLLLLVAVSLFYIPSVMLHYAASLSVLFS
jgi:hypothetical protein